MEESDAARLAAEHLAELDRQGIVEARRPAAQTKKLVKPEDAVPGAVFVGKGHPLAPPGSTELTAESFRDYVKTLQAEAAITPEVARMLIDLDGAPQLVCDCGVGRYGYDQEIKYVL